MSRRDIFSTLFMSQEAFKAKIIMAPTDGDGGGGGGGGGGPTGTSGPVITAIVPDKSTLTIGGYVKFTVSITNAYTSCTLVGDGINGSLSVANGVQTVEIYPTSYGTKTYSATAVNSSGVSSTLSVDITVLALPTISEFTANIVGNNVELKGTWSPTTGSGITARITYANTSIENVVSGQTYTVPKPSVSTTYVLQARNEAGYGTQESRTVTASSLNPTITSFTSTSQTVDAGTQFSLTGVFSNGTGVITRSKGTFSQNGSASISCVSNTPIQTTISETTTFTLRVTATQ